MAEFVARVKSIAVFWMTKKMRILLLLPRPLFPADAGGKIRTLNIFSRLAERMEIHAISLADREKDAAGIQKMQGRFHSYTPVFWQETPKFSPVFYFEFLANRVTRFPYFLSKYRIPQFRAAVEAKLAVERFDLILADFLQSAVVLLDELASRPAPAIPRVIFQHNVEYVIRKRHWQTETHPVKKWLLNAEWKKAQAIEAEVCRTFQHVIAVSEEDRNQFAREFGITHVSDLPTGVDVDYFRPNISTPQRTGNMVFVGSMDWHPNEDGISWFLNESYPRIRESVPQANLTIVGKNPSSQLREIAGRHPGVEITGTVDDVRPYLHRAQVAIVPLRIGGGTRIKIFEAMAAERPVVSTTLGAEGLPLANGREIVLEDSAEGFAAAVSHLLHDDAQCQRLARVGREKVVRDHTWESVAQRMEEILNRAAGFRATTEAAPVLAER